MKNTFIFLSLMLPYLVFGQCEKQVVELNNGYLKYYVGNNGEIKTFDQVKHSAVTDVRDSVLFSNGFSKALWFMGVQDDSITNLSIVVRGYSNGREFQPGILDSSGEPINSNCEVFGKVWNVYRSDVLSVRKLFSDGLLTTSDIPTDILTWPAKGNPHLRDEQGNVIVDRALAPFVDYDGNGTYNPLDGDYPIPLKEQIDFLPSQYTFHVYHDVGPDISTPEAPLNIEVCQIVYVVDCEEYPDLNQSIFHRVEINYKGQTDLDLMKIALYDDADIGNVYNDYGGVDLGTNSLFTYSTMDEFTSFNSINLPEYYTAYQATIFLNDSIDYTAPIIPEIHLAPNIESRVRPAFFGRTWEGLPAIDPVTGDTSNYWYPYNPSDNLWNMEGNTANFYDHQTLAVFDHHDVEKRSSFTLDFIETTRIEPLIMPATDLFLDYEIHINDIKAQYANLIEGSICTKNPEIGNCQENCVWPGDVNNDSVVTLEDYLLLKSTELMQSINREGPARQRESARWLPMASNQWGQSINGIDGKYYDVDGNGILGEFDEAKGVDNFKKTNESGEYPHKIAIQDSLGLSIVIEGFAEDEDSLNYFTKDFNSYLLVMKVNIGDGTNSRPIAELCFDLKVDTINMQILGPTNAPLLSLEKNVFTYQANTYAQEHYCFASDTASGLNGELLDRLFTLTRPSTPDTGYVNFLLENIYAIDTAGNFIEVGVRNAPPLKDIRSLPTPTKDYTPISFALYPNPVTDEVIISSTEDISLILVRDMQGQVVLQSKGLGKSTSLDISAISSGVYMLEVVAPRGTAIKKLVKL